MGIFNWMEFDGIMTSVPKIFPVQEQRQQPIHAEARLMIHNEDTASKRSGSGCAQEMIGGNVSPLNNPPKRRTPSRTYAETAGDEASFPRGGRMQGMERLINSSSRCRTSILNIICRKNRSPVEHASRIRIAMRPCLEAGYEQERKL